MTEPETTPTKKWTAQAACKGKTDLFFVSRGETSKMQMAKAICATCPVIDPCREYVIYHAERFGVWAGMSEKDRRQNRLQQGIKLSPAQHGTVRRRQAGCRCLECHTARRP